MMHTSDILIIGAGPGGYETAAEAARAGLKVTLIERDKLGGTCLNRGCIPTKCLCRSAEIAGEVAEAAEFGVEVQGVAMNWAAASARMRRVVDQLLEGVASALKGVEIVKGEARFISDKEVEADGDTYTAGKIIIATGSAPAMLPVEGAELAMSSDDVLALGSLPQSMAIIGGGVIGMEFACILHRFGVNVTVVEYCKEILPPFDRDIAKRLHSTLSRRGISTITSAEVKALHKSTDGIEVDYLSRKGMEKLHVEAVMMAVGRKPVLPAGIANTSINYGPRGIVTDASMETSVKGVYAIGDVNGRCMLAHAATAQGRVALGHMVDLNVIPSAVFTSPEAAMVGLTEEQCKADGVDFKTAKALFGANGKATAMGEPSGMVKLNYNPMTGVLYGGHILGPHAADLIQEVATVMASGLGIKAIADAIHAHPTLSEVVAEAARNAM